MAHGFLFLHKAHFIGHFCVFMSGSYNFGSTTGLQPHASKRPDIIDQSNGYDLFGAEHIIVILVYVYSGMGLFLTSMLSQDHVALQRLVVRQQVYFVWK